MAFKTATDLTIRQANIWVVLGILPGGHTCLVVAAVLYGVIYKAKISVLGTRGNNFSNGKLHGEHCGPSCPT